MNKPTRSYGSVEDHHTLRCPPARPLSHNNPGHQHQNRQPKLDEVRVCQIAKQRTRYAVGVAVVLGLTLAIFALGSKVASTRSENSSTNLAAESDARIEWGKTFSGRVRELSLRARNEYGEFGSLALYGLDMLVEPYKETALIVDDANITTDSEQDKKFHWELWPADELGVPVAEGVSLLDVALRAEEGGPRITLTEPGTMYLLKVTETRDYGGGSLVVGEGRAVISCKYVRRELRELTTKDREAFFDAMQEFYTVPSDEDSAGDRPGFNHYQHFAEVHNSKHFCYHNGMQFLTAHLAFDWVVERALQQINPAVSLAFWDMTIESGTLGAHWPESDLFSSDMFGSALGSADNGYQVADGRFANVSSIYDPDSLLVSALVSPVHNPYGYISGTYDYQDVPKLTRTHSFCGFTGTSSFASCEDLIKCFDENTRVSLWSKCMEDTIHSDMHGWLGGAWDCKADMGEFKNEHPEFSDELLNFVLQFATANRWPTNALFADYNTCDTSCERGSDELCGCTCLIDPGHMTDEEVYDVAAGVLMVFSTIYRSEYFITFDPARKYPWMFKQDGNLLDEGSMMLLMRYLITVGCEPSKVGAMATGASPMDPIFWVLHPMFEKALHLLLLSPEYNSAYDFTWEDSSCYGSGLMDRLPFTENSLGQGSGTTLLTNEDILRIADPSTNPTMPYIYDNYNSWGTCSDWDPCTECT